MAWYNNFERRVLAQLDRMELSHHDLIRFLFVQEKEIMSALDDLKASIADLTTIITDAVSEIETLLGKITTPGTSDADVQAAVSQIQAITGSIKTEVAKARAAAP